jgi:2'-5' RNA ligase
MPRLFIGSNAPDRIPEGPSIKLKGQFKRSKINWVDPENFHITLKFLGVG